jgi:membrane protein required for colicin V production
MTVIDWSIVALVSLSFLLGVLRGFVREVISIVGWVAGAYLAVRFSSELGAQIPLDIEWPIVKTLLAGVLIVVTCVFVAALVGWIARRLLVAAKLSIADRTLGGVFGLARGALIIAILVFFARDTQVARQPFWRHSLVLPQIEAGVRFVTRQVSIAGLAPV